MQVKELIEKINSKKVLTVGDTMLDYYLIGSAERLSPEAPVPVIRPSKRESNLGGAGNTAANVACLGAQSCLATIIGDDDAGKDILKLAGTHNIVCTNVLVGESVITTTKERIVGNGQQIVRIDMEYPESYLSYWTKFSGMLTGSNVTYDAIIVSDYNKGVVSPSVLSALNGTKYLAVDSKQDITMFRNVDVITPNLSEFNAIIKSLDISERYTSDTNKLESYARVLMKLTGIRSVMITLGPLGMLVITSDEIISQYAYTVPVYDVSGAGDTVIASYVLATISGADPKQASRFAAMAASLAVSRTGTSPVDAMSMLAQYGDKEL